MGLVTGTCLADSGNDVTCIDIDQRRLRPSIETRSLSTSRVFETGRANREAKRLTFTTDLAAGVKPAADLSGSGHTQPRRRVGRSVGAVEGG